MDFDEAHDAFFAPREDGAADPTPSTPGRALRHVLEPIATIHWWSPAVYARYEAEGLDFLTGYTWSRSCVLGETEGTVVAAAFGVFEPGLIAGLFDQARAACSVERIRQVSAEGAGEALREAVGGDADLRDAVAALRRGAEAGDLMGRPLFAGWRGLPWPEDPMVALWHGANLLREYRGDSHLAASVAVGLTGLQANILTEMALGWERFAYTGTRGWSLEAMDQAESDLTHRGLVEGGHLSPGGLDLRAAVEAATELAMKPVLTAIGGDLDDLVAALEGPAQGVLDKGWFPPDPLKRAAG